MRSNSIKLALTAMAMLTTGASSASAKSMLTGDFNGDGRADLAVSAFNESRDNGLQEAGIVHVIYGSALKLKATGSQLWHEDIAGVLGESEYRGRFGHALAAGDFNGDGFDDLAVSATGVFTGGFVGHGRVHILFGSAAGITAAANLLLDQGALGAPFRTNSGFGYELEAGDFNRDGRDDLAISEFRGTVGLLSGAGIVHVAYGATSGFGSFQHWSQNSPGVLDAAEANDNFGNALEAGDFDGDGFDDLGIGVMNEKIGAAAHAGAVNLLYGGGTGLQAARNQFWHQNSPGVPGAVKAYDQFGWSLASGDFNGDARDDLAIGTFGDEVAGESAGTVTVLYGSESAGLVASGSQFLHENVAGIADAIDWVDGFGLALAAGDFNNDGHDDLAIGNEDQSIGNVNYAGAVHVLAGSATGLRPAGSQYWHLDSPSVKGASASGSSKFGHALAAGDFDGNHRTDLAIVASTEPVATKHSTGAVHVLYGGGSLLTSAANQLWHQNTAGIGDSCEDMDQLGQRLMPNLP